MVRDGRPVVGRRRSAGNKVLIHCSIELCLKTIGSSYSRRRPLLLHDCSFNLRLIFFSSSIVQTHSRYLPSILVYLKEWNWLGCALYCFLSTTRPELVLIFRSDSTNSAEAGNIIVTSLRHNDNMSQRHNVVGTSGHCTTHLACPRRVWRGGPPWPPPAGRARGGGDSATTTTLQQQQQQQQSGSSSCHFSDTSVQPSHCVSSAGHAVTILGASPHDKIYHR